MRVSNVLQCPADNRVVFAMLFCLAVLSSLILIANPGFFSHDELERTDIVLRYGFSHYLSSWVMPHPGDEFGAPVRPISFLILGVVSLFLPTYPFLVHLIDVLMHGAVSLMLFEATRRLHGDRQLAWASAILFLICPLAAFSVGWSAALMDRLYIFFGLLAFIAAHTYLTQQRGWLALLAVFVASMLAILSKETALILPGLLVVYPIFLQVSLKSKRLWITFMVWSAPVFLFLLYRAPALINSFSGKVATPYSPTLANVPEGVFVYFVYPFLPTLTEAHSYGNQSSPVIWAAAALHLALLIMLWRVFSFRAALAYLVGYLIFLIPVLLISAKGAHYLYGSGLVFSIAIGALLTLNWRQESRRLLFFLPIGMLVVATFHTLVIQRYFYNTGSCMSSIANTIESSYLTEGAPEKMTFLVEPGAPGHVLRRFTHHRERIGSHFPVKFEVVDWDKRNEGKSKFIFNSACVVYMPVTAKNK